MMDKAFISQKRIKSIVMWLGIIGSALMSIGLDWHNYDSWASLFKALFDFICNPAAVITFIIIIFGQINNPTHKNGI